MVVDVVVCANTGDIFAAGGVMRHGKSSVALDKNPVFSPPFNIFINASDLT